MRIGIVLVAVALLLTGCVATTTPPPQGPPTVAPPPPPPPPPPGPPPPYAPDHLVANPLPCPVDPAALGFGPVKWPSGSAPQRWGFGWTDIARVRTSKARPIEVCQVRGQLRWLMSLRCPDGAAPYPDPRTAHRSRAGSVGPGGRCGRVVDLYRVPCADRVYQVHLDLYHCTPEGE